MSFEKPKLLFNVNIISFLFLLIIFIIWGSLFWYFLKVSYLAAGADFGSEGSCMAAG